MEPGFEAVAFDLYGTLLDVSGLAARCSAVVGGEGGALLALWRKAQLERTWELNRDGAYQPFDVVTSRALAEHGLASL